MEYIDNSHKIRIEWTILRGTSKVREDFSRAKLALILLGPDWRYQLSPDIVDVEKGVIKTEIPAGLPEGVYGIKAIWIKDDHHPCEGRHFIHPKHPPVPPAHHPVPVGPHFYPYAGMWHKGYIPAPLDIRINSGKLAQARKDDLFGVTELVPECEHPGNTIVIKISSSVATYGYDGLDAYELAVLHGETMTEEEWLAGQSGGAGFRVIDSVDDAYIDDSTDALSVRQGVLLRQEIDRIWAKIEECCGKMAEIYNISPMSISLDEYGQDGNGNTEIEIAYETKGGVGDVEITPSDSAVRVVYEGDHSFRIKVDPTESWSERTFTVILRGKIGEDYTTSPVAIQITQAGKAVKVIAREIFAASCSFNYNVLPMTGPNGRPTCGVNTFIVAVREHYNNPNLSDKTVDYTVSQLSDVVFSKCVDGNGNLPGTYSVNPSTGLVTGRDATEGSIYDRAVLVSGNVPAKDGLAALPFTLVAKIEQSYGDFVRYNTPDVIISYGSHIPAEGTGNSYSVEPNFIVTPSVTFVSQTAVYRIDGNEYTTGPETYTWAEFKALCSPSNNDFNYAFIPLSSGIQINNDGCIKCSSANTSTSNTKSYNVRLNITVNGKSRTIDNINVVQDKAEVPKNVNVNYGAIRISYNGGSSVQAFKINYLTLEGSNTQYHLNDVVNPTFTLDDPSVDWVTPGSFTIGSDNMIVRAEVDPNPNTNNDLRRTTVTFSGTLNGVSFSKVLSLYQDSVGRYVWYGYYKFDGTTTVIPTDFEHRGISTSADIGVGPFTVSPTTADQPMSHWVLIPEDSGYTVDKIKNDLQFDVTDTFHTTVIQDSKLRNYVMWYYNSPDGTYYDATSIITLKQ